MTTWSVEEILDDRELAKAQDVRELSAEEVEAVAGGSGYIDASGRSGYISSSD